MQRRVLVIGPCGAGKTSLIRLISGLGGPIRKTQVMEYSGFAVDTPGEYVQIPRLFYTALSLTGDVSAVWALQDATGAEPGLPAGFASSFRDKAVGIVTKIDCAGCDLSRAERFLAYAGVPGPYYHVSAVTGEGIERLANTLMLRFERHPRPSTVRTGVTVTTAVEQVRRL